MILNGTHGNFVYPRRVSQLARNIAELLPPSAKVLDVGCGDGLLSLEITKLRTDIRVVGIDVLVRQSTLIPVMKFDGKTIPYPHKSFDVLMFVDVLHHTIDPTILLRESKRVAREAILIKDHTCHGLLAAQRLRFMDWVGNARHGVVLPYNYWTEENWRKELENLGLYIEHWVDDLDIYPWWADWLFGSSLQFITRVHTNRSV